MEEYVIALIVGIVLCGLGILMMFTNLLNFIIARFESFQKAIRKKEFNVDKEGLSKFYAILWIVLGVLLIIGAIIGFINHESYESFSMWIFVVIIAIGFIGILYCNISNRFIQYKEQPLT
jgi:MFS family permease